MAFITLRTDKTRRVLELKGQATIGRGVTADVLLDDPRASKHHAQIRESQGRWLLKDMGSTNGTSLRGVKVGAEVSLMDGDEIVIGDTTLVFTRQEPPGAGKPAPETTVRRKTSRRESNSRVLREESLSARAPKGTLSIPVERFELGEGSEEREPPAGAAIWLRGLYRLLREANPCEGEDELFEVATRVLAEALPGARVQILFEAGWGPVPDGVKPTRKTTSVKRQTLLLSTWQRPGTSRQTRVLGERLQEQRMQLVTYARERGVAVLSPDLETDARTSSTRLKAAGGEGDEKLSIMIAPLQIGRAVLGYLLAERTLRGERGGERHSAFTPDHLEFLAAAAYPLATMLSNVRKHQSVLGHNARLQASVADRYRMVGDSSKLHAAMQVIERAAPFDSPVLILGESGTGKELAARGLHALSNRRNGPFEAINCAALPENLVESELFGHARGAFTGATSDRAGYFETASGGTLFLDEVGELPLPVQAKLLRVLEESRISRVGESRLREVDCRIVAATNRDLEEEVKASRFRQDLYYRLRVMDVTLPPLRERLEDLPLLCKHLLTPFGNYRISPEALALLERYPWPGNIRELRNTLERMAVLSRPNSSSHTPRGSTRGGVVTLAREDVPLDIRRAVEGEAAALTAPAGGKTGTLPAPAGSADGVFRIASTEIKALEDLHIAYARWVLEQVKGNKTKAAKLLGIQRSTLYSWTEWKDKG